jgi:hypothetical protein
MHKSSAKETFFVDYEHKKVQKYKKSACFELLMFLCYVSLLADVTYLS